MRSSEVCRRSAAIGYRPRAWLIFAPVIAGTLLSVAPITALRAQTEPPKSKEEVVVSKVKAQLPTPLPPVRPPGLTAPAAPQQPSTANRPASPAPAQGETLPDVTGPAPRTSAPANAGSGSSATQATLPPPPTLPPASRARMHECGREWEKIKASGAAADQTWRAFAQICLSKP